MVSPGWNFMDFMDFSVSEVRHALRNGSNAPKTYSTQNKKRFPEIFSFLVDLRPQTWLRGTISRCDMSWESNFEKSDLSDEKSSEYE